MTGKGQMKIDVSCPALELLIEEQCASEDRHQ
jgi:hypothetical protein